MKNYEITLSPYTKKNDPTIELIIKTKTSLEKIIITKSPTGNCQLSSLAYTNHLFYLAKQEDIIDVLKECYKLCNFNPKLIFIDVRTEYTKKIEKTFETITKTPYTSSNNTEMCAFIIILKPPENKSKITKLIKNIIHYTMMTILTILTLFVTLILIVTYNIQKIYHKLTN